MGIVPTACLSHRYRKKTIIFVEFILSTIGVALQAAVVNLPMFTVARFILGFAIVGVAHTSPILINE